MTKIPNSKRFSIDGVVKKQPAVIASTAKQSVSIQGAKMFGIALSLRSSQ